MPKEKSNMEIKVSFLAGTPLESALKEAKQKARLFNVTYIKFSFNGVDFAIGQSADIEACLEKYPTSTHIVSA